MKRLTGLAVFVFLAISAIASAEIRLAAVISDGMVLQQKTSVPIWGWGLAGEKVTVKCGWGGDVLATTVGDDGKWKVKINTPKAGGPYQIRICGDNQRVLEDVLIGEVWVCSGQSNMLFALRKSKGGKDQAAKANYSKIRFFEVGRAISDEPLENSNGSQWKVCTQETAADFSAVGYFFGKRLHEKLDVPVGLIEADWGGTPAEAWTPMEMLKSEAEFETIFKMWQDWEASSSKDKKDYDSRLKEWEQAVAAAKNDGRDVPKKPSEPRSIYILRRPHRRPAVLYNGMIAPVVPYGIKGVIWYQGESNRDQPYLYRKLLGTMIEGWRNAWDQGDFPFYYVQIAPFGYSNGEAAVLIREAQLMTMSIPNTGMAVTMDLGNPRDIHPIDKKPVGERLALWALAKDYGFKGVVHSGPIYRSAEGENGKIRLKFDHADSGLVIKDATAGNFIIAGADRRFVEAKAVVDGDTILVANEKVTDPVAMRYCWGAANEGTLFNKEGLPASSFRTDDWGIREKY